jgi:hypothetical protein
VSALRWLVAGLSLRRSEFDSRQSLVGCVVERVALKKDFFPFPLFSPVSIIPSILHPQLHLNTRLLSSEGRAGQICETSNQIKLCSVWETFERRIHSYHIDEDQNRQLCHYESLKTREAGYFAQQVVFGPGRGLDRHPESIVSS